MLPSFVYNIACQPRQVKGQKDKKIFLGPPEIRADGSSFLVPEKPGHSKKTFLG